MGFLWVNGFSFFHCVAFPFHSFVTTNSAPYTRLITTSAPDSRCTSASSHPARERTTLVRSRWLAGCMGSLWVNGFSFFHCVASPFYSFVTTTLVSQGELEGTILRASSSSFTCLSASSRSTLEIRNGGLFGGMTPSGTGTHSGVNSRTLLSVGASKTSANSCSISPTRFDLSDGLVRCHDKHERRATRRRVALRKQHRPGIAPNANTTYVPTAGSSAAPTKPNHTP